jgi:hypothetical protein
MQSRLALPWPVSPSASHRTFGAAAMLSRCKKSSALMPAAALRRYCVGAIRANWPKVEILLRADSHYACPEVFDWCRDNRVAGFEVIAILDRNCGNR